VAVVGHHDGEALLERVVDGSENRRCREHPTRAALCHKDAPVIEFAGDNGFVKVIRVQLVAGSTVDRIIEIPNDDVKGARVVPQAVIRVIVNEL
jgi:hypothetical protein